jgi:hypothetical protein
MSAKTIFEDVLSVPIVKKLWTANYDPAIPFTIQGFDIGSLLPAILYMFRWGHRRGKGKFIEAYGNKNDKKSIATINSILSVLCERNEFNGFNNDATKAILGDMLLASCLENKNHQPGRDEKVQRAFPTHYLASWIDLPDEVGHLRFIPELLVAILLHQEQDEYIQRSLRKTHFDVGCGFDGDNILLSLFGNGMSVSGNHQDITSDHFKENDLSVSIDQLLTIRLAQGCCEAPYKNRTGNDGKIKNRWPIAIRAMDTFKSDFNIYVQIYGDNISRQTFLQMLESCLSLGLTNIYFSTVNMLSAWHKSGKLPVYDDQSSWPLFVDCSSSNDKELRNLAEESMSQFIRQLAHLPNILMSMGIIETKIRNDRQLRETIPTLCPDSTEFINFMGSIYKNIHPRSERLFDNLEEKCFEIAEALGANEGVEPELQELLRGIDNPIDRLSESLCKLMGEKNHFSKHITVLNSLLLIDMPNGMAQKRKISRKSVSGKNISTDVRSIVLTNTMLDFIVHRHLRKAAKRKRQNTLTFIDLLHILRDQYGLYVDESPPGMQISAEQLLRNKRILERRLRDLGVLIGVNDAETMKKLCPRFHVADDD